MIMYESPPSRYIYVFKRKELESLRNFGRTVDWENNDGRREFFYQLYYLIKDWNVQLPYLLSIFKQDELDFLLIQAAILDNYIGQEFIEFVVRTGYKDRLEVPEDDKYKPSVLHRTTAIHHAARNKPNDWKCKVEDLFKIYDRFDVNYVDDFGLTHFHAACMVTNCANVVRKFLEQGLVDPNLIWPETGDSPLHLSVSHGGYESVEILLRNGADPNSANKDGLTSLHMSMRRTDHGNMKLLSKIGEDTKCPLQVNARDNFGNTPLHLALNYKDMKVAEMLLRGGANPNLPNNGGQTPLHIICQSDERYTPLYIECGEVETFFKINEELNQPVQVDARDKLGRTPLQLAVANLRPHAVESLLNHGADLSSFVLPPENDFAARFYPRDDIYWAHLKYINACGALAILESLEKRGYQVKDFVLIIMKLLKLRLFKKSTYVQTRWYDDEEFASRTKQIKILPRMSIGDYDYLPEFERATIETAMTPSLSLYDLMRLRPEEAAKVFTYRDYYCRDIFWLIYTLPRKYDTYINTYFYETVPRGFCRRWARDYFFELIRHRLSIPCCEKIIDQLMNEDLCNICFAATGQDP